ncbi:flagellar hook capping FlgD N-terminal domain-containing protein [Amaricoccus solimangrovi]|uniref:Basal-body rod modification protein FlgD n=1 Tax=Amaricoccus solimangrovi TaxID=2589815 RepID=A0A501WV06_9RHOB|nr:flagellar hook capping FlgD N-terminal domain-containing protein [Amaricoccus solimangrovi]TPE53583.1 flagellar basal body rod modification protein [Amaricoccus solimangrovi]
MDLTSTTTATTAPGGATASATRTAAGTATSAASGALTADFDTFLKLLTTQMKYQDPLQPMDSTEFVAQLASFSAVEQQIGSNTRLDSILAALGGGAAGGFADWIGREVQAPTSAAFTGDPVEIGVTPEAGADRAVLVVRNDFGAEVTRLGVDPAATSVTWDGTDAQGATAASGSYGFTLESYSGDVPLPTTEGRVFSTVTEVRRGAAGETELVLATGDMVSAGEITALR